LTVSRLIANTEPPNNSPKTNARSKERRGAAAAGGNCLSRRPFRLAMKSAGGSTRIRWRKSSFIAALQSPSAPQRLHDAVKNGSDVRLAQPGELRDEAIVDGGAWSA
jgi:hypothetical protein